MQKMQKNAIKHAEKYVNLKYHDVKYATTFMDMQNMWIKKYAKWYVEYAKYAKSYVNLRNMQTNMQTTGNHMQCE